MDNERTKNLLAVATIGAILESIEASQPFGAPGGVLYAGLMSFGCRLEQFESIMGNLASGGFVKRQAHYYQITDKGKALIASINQLAA